MAFKLAALLALLAVLGIFETQAASVVSEKDMWNYRDSDSDDDKRTADEDSVESEYFPDEKDTIAEDAYASDVAADIDYYNSALDNRGVPCKDAFHILCLRKFKRKCRYVPSRSMNFAKKYCPETCPQLCKK